MMNSTDFGFLEGDGGEVIVIPFIEGYSTTAIADRLKEAE